MKISLPYIICLSILFILVGCDDESSVPANYENYFVKYYGNEGDQEGVDVEILADGFVVLGTSYVGTNSSLYIVRTDEIGNELWSKQFGGTTTVANALAVDASGNLLVAATNTLSTSDKNVLLLRLSPDGTLTDSLSFGQVNEIETASDITITSSGDIIIIGTTTNVFTSKPGFNPITDLEDIYTIRLNASLIPYSLANWRRVTGFPEIERGVSIVEKADGTFGIFGSTNKPAPGSSQKAGFNMFYFPAGNDGEALADDQLFGTLSNESGHEMIRTSTGEFVMIGSTTVSNVSDVYVARVQSNNNFISAGALNTGKDIQGISVAESQAGGLLILGTENINNNGNIYLIRTGITGNVLWEESFGGTDNDSGSKVKEMFDGSVIIVGTVELESQTKVALIKTNSKGKLQP